MIEYANERDFLLKRLGTKEGSAKFPQGQRSILEVFNDDGESVEYYIGDFREGMGDFKKYLEELEERGIEVKPLLIFKSWQQEQDYYDEVIKKGNSSEKRKIKGLFEKSHMVYFPKEASIKLELEDKGINFLEYIEDDVEGFIVNLPLKELSKLYNQTGKNLFKDNVRVGISNPSKSSTLRAGFKEVFERGLYLLYKERNSSFFKYVETYIRNERFLQDDNKDSKILENFWFHHNGITIFSEQRYDIKDESISFLSEKVSVINGAQTLTHCFSLMREIKNEWLYMFKEKLGEGKDFEKAKTELTEMIKFVKSIVKLKVIFLFSENSSLKRSITYGLNNQIPIVEEDILGNSKLVEDINGVLRYKGIKICRSGEYIDYERNLDVLEFTKLYLTFEGNPGSARNLNKKTLETELGKILSDLTKDLTRVEELASSIALFHKIDEWWRKKKAPEFLDVGNESYKGLERNGKYYFKAFCFNSYKELLDFEFDVEGTLQGIYEEFIIKFLEISNSTIDSNVLKNDKLFNEYLNRITSQWSGSNIDLDDMQKEYEKIQKLETGFGVAEKRSKSSKNLFIRKYFEEKGIKKNFRTITLKNGKVSEGFSFTSDTFRALYECKGYPEIYENSDYTGEISFENSIFKEKILESFWLVIFCEDSKEDGSAAMNIKLMKDFSFRDYLKEAEETYKKTLSAFKKGDTKLFPKISENKYFHIRPKAKDSKDTFEFTNGEQEIKRTFWANKETIQNILDSHKNNNFKKQVLMV